MTASIDTSTVDTIIGSRIRQQRAAIGLTLRQLGDRANLSVSFLSDLENGKRGVSAENLLAVARALDVPPGWFFAPLTGETRRKPMSPRTPLRYVAECGSWCPHCEDATQAIRRNVSHARAGRDGDTQRILAVPCFCCVCNGSWVETYRLQSMADAGEEE